MTWRDKLEIGLKEDAPYRKDNLPLFQVRGAETPTGPGRSPEVPAARHDPTGPSDVPDTDALPYAVAAEATQGDDAVKTDESASLAMSDEGAPLRKDD